MTSNVMYKGSNIECRTHGGKARRVHVYFTYKPRLVTVGPMQEYKEESVVSLPCITNCEHLVKGICTKRFKK